MLNDPAAWARPAPLQHYGSYPAAIEMRFTRSRSLRLLASAAIVTVIAAAAAGCQTTQNTATTGSLVIAPTERADADWRHDVEVYGQQYRVDPTKVDVALRYAQALRSTGERAQAVAVLEQISIQNPKNKIVLGEYGRALSEAGNYEQALEVFDRAHTPDQPDWHILSAQGAVLDQMGRHQEAQRYYLTALKIVPDEPSILSNLGLSYALSKDLKNAEVTLRRAVAQHPVDPRVRQNLALVVGLQGRFAEAEDIARADLPPEQAAANVAYLRQMIAHKTDISTINQPARPAHGSS
ncbi:MAG TPA: tetratricopeptide repeat protein [Xanthobacteraceae bacterium]|nr:tetratricopeptide repeat protein [Xanthobacteraceae bacterium]